MAVHVHRSIAGASGVVLHVQRHTAVAILYERVRGGVRHGVLLPRALHARCTGGETQLHSLRHAQLVAVSMRIALAVHVHRGVAVASGVVLHVQRHATESIFRQRAAVLGDRIGLPVTHQPRRPGAVADGRAWLQTQRIVVAIRPFTIDLDLGVVAVAVFRRDNVNRHLDLTPRTTTRLNHCYQPQSQPQDQQRSNQELSSST